MQQDTGNLQQIRHQDCFSLGSTPKAGIWGTFNQNPS